MSNQLAKIEPSALTVVTPQSPFELLAVAVKQGVDVATMERLEGLYERQMLRQAKQAFDDAMSAFQTECPIILKTVDGAQSKYRFAPLDHIVTQVRGLIAKHGFRYTITSETDKDGVQAIVKVTHRLGHFEESKFKCPVDSRNPVMNASQQIGGAMTFAKRYAFCNAFGILTADEDRDGQTPKPKAAPVDSERKKAIARLWDILLPVRGTQQNWKLATQWLADELGEDTFDYKQAPTDEVNRIADKAAHKLTKFAR